MPQPWTSRPRVRVLRSLATGAPWSFALALVLLLAEGLLPVLALVAMGAVVGAIPGAVAHGLGSPAGHRLLGRLAVAGALYGLSLLRGPAQDALGASVQARLAALQQRRLVAAVGAPEGIAHLEDPLVLDRLASAQGELTAYEPAAAAMTLISSLGARLSGLLACAVLAGFRWWLGLAMCALWLAVRPPLRALVRSRTGTFRQATEPLRRSWYYLGLAWRPNAAKEMRVFGLGAWAVGQYRSRNDAAMAPSWAEATRLNRRIGWLAPAVLAGYGLSIGYLANAGYHHEISLGTLTTMLTMLPSTMQLGAVTGDDFALETMLTSVPDLDALTAGLRAEPAPATPGAPAVLRESLRFEAVSFRYPGTDRDVLDGLDLTLAAGRSTAVVGVNGAGKTTLITVLAGLRQPTGGRVLLDGEPLPPGWQRRVAAVFQDFARFPLTAAENVALGLRGEPVDEELLAEVAARSGAAEVVARLPDGWDTVLSARYPGGRDLSGGQWQRMALARALYAVGRGAQVLVLDEPTAQLDVRAEADFYDRFLEITEGVTSVVISHRFSTVRRADLIAVLDGGAITELGGHADLLAAGGTYAGMFELQAARFG